MATSALNELLQKADLLTPDEQLWLIAHLAEKVRAAQPDAKPRRKWKEICGIVPYPMFGEDAQAYITRTRREADAHREQQLRRSG